jgi:hypothetical protein
MRDSGRWDIEAHTRDFHGLTDVTAGGEKGHLYSNLRWLADQNRLETQEEFVARITADLRGAQEDLLRELKVRSSVFAFPFGDYGQDTVNNPAAQGAVLEAVSKVYAAAFVQEQASGTPSSQNRPGADPTTLKRIEVYPNWTPANVLKMVAIGAPKQAFFRDDFTDYQGWLTSYGSVQYLGDNRMRLGAQPDGNSASVVLDGANDWTDYTYNARFQAGSVGTNVSLVGRYRDENNFVTCTVTPERVRIEQRAGGVNRVLAEARYPVGPTPVTSLTMAVTGSAVACTGPKRVAAAIDQAAAATLRSGGIGVKIWNPTRAAASVAMAEIYVTPAA